MTAGTALCPEVYNLKRRRRWAPERLILDRERRAKARAKFTSYVPCPLKPADTVRMFREELEVIERIRNSGEIWVKMWPFLNELAGLGPERDKRPRRQAYLALVTRMISEKKLLRHRLSSSLALAEWLRAPAHQEIT